MLLGLRLVAGENSRDVVKYIIENFRDKPKVVAMDDCVGNEEGMPDIDKIVSKPFIPEDMRDVILDVANKEAPRQARFIPVSKPL